MRYLRLEKPLADPYICVTVTLKQPEARRNGWLSQIPQGRMAKPAELKAVSNHKPQRRET
jgi:hypothetical protein